MPRARVSMGSPSALRRAPISGWCGIGLAGVALAAGLDAARPGAALLAGALAVVMLLVALAGRRGDTALVGVAAVAATLASGVWNGWDADWIAAVAAVVAVAVIAGLVAVLRANAVTAARRLELLRDLLALVDQPGVEAIVPKLLGALVPAFADGCAVEADGCRLGVGGVEPPDGRWDMVLRLQARGTVFGSLRLVLGPSGRRYSAGDRDYADLVAGRVAVVLDNAGLSRQAATAERRLVAALDALGAAVTMNGPDGRTVYVNRAAVPLLGARSAEEITTAPVGAISSPFAFFDEQGRELDYTELPTFVAIRGEAHEPTKLMRRVVRATGEERWLRVTVTVLRTLDGSLDRVVNVIEDVTTVKRAELARAEVARELQQGLLPPQLPEIAGLELAALYRPAAVVAEVGGDFYDAFATPRGWMLVIGDVAGQGAQAAALTGLARFTLRSVGQLTGDPLQCAAQLNRTLREQPEFSLCTAACVRLEPRGRELLATTVSCGHPLPALLRDGAVTELGAPGPLAGAFDDAAWTAHTARLRASDVVVLYTDGVFDSLGPRGRLGEDRLRDVLAHAPAGAYAVVRHVDRALAAFAGGPPADDTALVAVTIEDPAMVPVPGA